MDIAQFDTLLHDAEVKLKRLKALYEQYFQGIERLEPAVARKDLDRTFITLAREKPRNTAARFRLQQLKARYNLYQSYWQRICRQIEEGTYERDVRRARRRGARRRPVEEQPVKTFELDIDVQVEPDSGSIFGEGDISAALDALRERQSVPSPGRPSLSPFSPFASPSKPPEGGAPKRATFGRPRVSSAPPAGPASGPATASPRPSPPAPPTPPRPPAQARPPSPPAARPPPPPSPPRPPARPPAAPSASADPMKRLYDDYVAARRQNNEPIDSLRYEKMAASVDKMKSKLRAKHGDEKDIGFEVVVRDGRVGLKPKIGT